MGGLRRSEVSALEWRDVSDARDGDGVLLTVRTSKTNQEGDAADVRYLKNGAAKAIRTLRAAAATAAPPVPAWERKADAAGEKILTELHDLAAQAVKVESWANRRFDLRAAMHHRLFRHTNPDAAAAIDLGKAASKSVEVKRGIRHFTRLVAPHLFRPGYRVRRARGPDARVGLPAQGPGRRRRRHRLPGHDPGSHDHTRARSYARVPEPSAL